MFAAAHTLKVRPSYPGYASPRPMLTRANAEHTRPLNRIPVLNDTETLRRYRFTYMDSEYVATVYDIPAQGRWPSLRTEKPDNIKCI